MLNNKIIKLKRILVILIFLLAIQAKDVISQANELLLLNDIHGKAVLGKYITSNKYFNWNVQLEVSDDILRYNDCVFYLLVNNETIIRDENDISVWRPIKINYMIESGLRVQSMSDIYSFFYHHISRHDVDGYIGATQSWNILEFKYDFKNYKLLKKHYKFKKYIQPYGTVSIGRYVNTNNVSYEWDGLLKTGINVDKSKRSGLFYVESNIHYTSQGENRTDGNNYFIDYSFEPGLIIYGVKGDFNIFCQYQHKNDADKYNGTALDCYLLGFRYK